MGGKGPFMMIFLPHFCFKYLRCIVLGLEESIFSCSQEIQENVLQREIKKIDLINN